MRGEADDQCVGDGACLGMRWVLLLTRQTAALSCEQMRVITCYSVGIALIPVFGARKGGWSLSGCGRELSAKNSRISAVRTPFCVIFDAI